MELCEEQKTKFTILMDRNCYPSWMMLLWKEHIPPSVAFNVPRWIALKADNARATANLPP